jgi:hypothetical protein
LPAYNEPFDEKVKLISPSAGSFQIRVDGSELPSLQVSGDGRATVHIPVLPRECSTYFLWVKITDRSVEARKILEFVRDGQVVKKISINHLRSLPADSAGFHELRL